MSGRAGAESTQVRAPTCISPPPLALHPHFNLSGFRVLLKPDRVFVFFSISLLVMQAPKAEKLSEKFCV